MFCVLWKMALQIGRVVRQILFLCNVHGTHVIKMSVPETVLSLFRPVITLFANMTGFIAHPMRIQTKNPLYGDVGKNR